MGKYEYKDIKKVIEAAGFVQVKNNGGSHQSFKNRLGFSIFLPEKANGVSVGVGNSVLDLIVLVCRIVKINIGAKSNDFAKPIAKYILDAQIKLKKRPALLIPKTVRSLNNINTDKDAFNYINKQVELFSKFSLVNKNIDNCGRDFA
jgi:predicted RNA binding protein YcfA (HicA-like mRNA interferase family)